MGKYHCTGVVGLMMTFVSLGLGQEAFAQNDLGEILPADSVIRIGYAEGNVVNLSGSVERVTERSMNKEQLTNPLEAIQGRVAGLAIKKGNNGTAALESVDRYREFHDLEGCFGNGAIWFEGRFRSNQYRDQERCRWAYPIEL